MSHTVNALTHRHPAGARLGLIVAHLYVPALAAITVVAAVTGHTWLAVLGVLTGLSGYPTGYLTAAHHYLKRLHREVAHARTDPLTGLPNRAVTDTILDQATPTGRPMTVALIDIDGLHIINGNFGHAAGDQYLTAVARRLAAATPASGVLVRQGGDEFTLLAPGYDPDRLADDIAAALTDPVLIAGHRIQPRVSVGIAATDQTGPVNGRRVRARADSALYSAKRRGGHQTCVFDADRDPEPSPDGTRPLLRRRDLNPATGTGLAWQPTVDDELVPLLLSFADIRAVHDALTTACDRWAQASTDADAHTGVRRPASPASSTPAPVNVEPTRAGRTGLARIAADQQAHYRLLLERLEPIVQTADTLDDAGHAPTDAPPVASVVLTGISAAFTPADLEALVITAAEAVHGQPADLSSRQRALAERAYALLRDSID